ncbi:MAG: hypothetical protein F4X19_04350 [Acidobacteria bacterium]|nr:hypothetical protein [Acidobacteriota bacterium]
MPKTGDSVIAHLKGREKLLRPLGFTRQQAEWITLACLHSGLFTRDQAGAFLRLTRRTAQRFVQALLQARISGRPVADAQTVDARRIYRIFGKAIYRELGLDNVRYRREASIEVMRRRLLSLDFVVDHPDLSWLASEQEKVACFEQLGIGRELFPKRIYTGRANGRGHYFHFKMPLAVEQDRAVFTYIDPGIGTRTELDSWGTAHRRLWEKLRQSGCRVEVVAVAWEQHLLDRAERVLTSWRGRGITEAEQEAAMLRQAIADTDFEIIERHGGFDAVVNRVLQVEEQSASTNGPGMIDGFHLWGSLRCRRMGVPLSEGGGDIEG